MPRLRTDDGPRKLRAVWLGPAGSTLPFQWTYVQWLVTLVAIPIGAALGGLLVWLLGVGLVWTFSVGVLWGAAAGVWVAVRVMRHVTYDEPLRYQRRLVRGEFSRRFSTGAELRPIEVAFTFPPIGYLSPAVRRAMGWDTPEQRPLDRRQVQSANPYLTGPPGMPRAALRKAGDPLGPPNKTRRSSKGATPLNPRNSRRSSKGDDPLEPPKKP
jgi:hypothetical protein